MMTAASSAAKSSTHLVRVRGRLRGRGRGRVRLRPRVRVRVRVRVRARARARARARIRVRVRGSSPRLGRPLAKRLVAAIAALVAAWPQLLRRLRGEG